MNITTLNNRYVNAQGKRNTYKKGSLEYKYFNELMKDLFYELQLKF